MGVLKVAVPSLNVLPLNAWGPTSLTGFSTENAIATLGTDCVTLQGDGSGQPPALIFDPMPLPPGMSVFTLFKLTVQGRRVAGAGGSGGLITLAARSWLSGSPRSTWGISSTGEVLSDAPLDEWQTLTLDHVYLQGFTPSGGDALQLVIQGSFGIDDDNVFEFRHLNLLPSTTSDYEDHSPSGWRKVGCGGNPAGDDAGRLKLWDGTRWVRERCNDDTGQLLPTDASTFEGTTTPGWVSLGSDQHEATSTDFAHSGTTSLNVTTDAPNAVWDGRCSIPVTPDVTYTFGVWMRTRNATPTLSVYLILQTFPTSGPDTQQTISGPFTVTNTWQHLTGSATAPSDAATGVFVIQAGGTFGIALDAFMDDIEVIGPAIGHPLKLWDGTTWQTVACMVPA